MADDLVADLFHLQREFLEENIDSDSGLLDKLQSSRTLTAKEIRFIKDQHPFDRRNAILLEYIINQNKYDCLINTLRDTKQTHLVNYLIANGEYRSEFGDDWPLTEAQIAILDINQEVLVDLIDPSELVGCLYARDVINKRQRDEISSNFICHKANTSLLEILRRRSLRDFKVAIQCLRKSNQSHVAEILDQGGAVVKVHAQGLDDTTEDQLIDSFANLLRDRPIEESVRILEGTLIALKKGQSVVLYIYCKTLEQLMNLKEIHTNGRLRKVVQRLFTDLLTSAETTGVTVENLHGIVESVFNTLLHRSEIHKIAITASDEEYARCRFYFPGDIRIRAVSDFNRFEMHSGQRKELRDVLQSTLRSYNEKRNTDKEHQETNSDKAKAVLNGHLDISEMSLCFKKGDIMETIPPVDTGNWWMVRHAKTGEIGYVPRNIVVVDYETNASPDCVQRQHGENLKSLRHKLSSKTSVNNLPFELLDFILQKSYLQSVLRGNLRPKNRNCDILHRLASVDLYWFHRLIKRQFKKEVWQKLHAFYRKKDKASSVYKINRQYFDQLNQLQGLICRLKSSDCLTDAQTAAACRSNFARKEKKAPCKRSIRFMDELLKVIDAKHPLFMRCLCDTEQQLFAHVAETGGVVVKSTVKFQNSQSSLDTRLMSSQLVERINFLQEETANRSPKIEIFLYQLKEKDLEILSACQDGDVADVWIWCKTQKALQNLQTISKSNCFVDVFSELARISPSLSARYEDRLNKPQVNIDSEQLKKTFVILSIFANFTSRIDVSEEGEVKGVTKLRDKIYVLFRHGVIRVFDDRGPFRLRKKLEITEIGFPADIASSENENCIFVLDSPDGKTNCVWVVREADGTEGKTEKVVRGLDLGQAGYYRPVTLSVTRDGHLLMINRRWNDHTYSLMIYGGSDSDLRLSFPLPQDIQEPWHAVETSRGNFIILHWISGQKKQDGEGDGEMKQMKDWMWVVSEVSRDGKTITRRFNPKNEEQKLNNARYLSIDSSDRVFVADNGNSRVILLDSDLRWNKVLIPPKEDKQEIERVDRLFYDEEKKQLIAVGRNFKGVNIYTLMRQ